MSEQGTTSSSWHQHPLVWFVIALPFSAVLFGIVMFVSANLEPDDLVVDDYYKEGKGINQRLQLDNEASRLDVVAHLTNVTDEGLVFSINEGSDELLLTLFHVADEKRDLSAPMIGLADDIYTVASVEMADVFRSPGIWYLEIKDEANSWRIRERVELPRQQLEISAR